MKLCPLCQHCYDDSFNACAHDRAALVGGRPGACLVAQKYSLERLLAGGGAEAVYAGRHLETDRPYAIELLQPEADAAALKNFRREALATAHLNTRVDHQHVAQTYDYGLLPDGTVYVVTELVAGQSLRQHMDEAGPLHTAAAVRIAQQVADGLEAAHRCGIVHRGLEPSNIILARDYDRRWEAKVVNFGFAGLLKQVGSRRRPDDHASPYAAPERRTGQHADARSDIYSLGVVLYEMLAGRLPFGDATAAASGHDRDAEPPPLSRVRDDVPEPLARLVTQLLRGRPSARPPSAADVAQRLRAVGNTLATGPTFAPPADAQSPAADVPPPPTSVHADKHPHASDGGARPAAQSEAEPRTPAREAGAESKSVDEAETVGANAAAYDDLDALQEELGRNLDEIIVGTSRNLDEAIVGTSAPAQPKGRAVTQLQPANASTSTRSPDARPLSGASRLGDARSRLSDGRAPRRSWPFYAAVAGLLLGLACGLWLASRRAPASPPAWPQAATAAVAARHAEPAAPAESSSAAESHSTDGAGEPHAGDADSTPAGAENQTPSETPGAADESAPPGPPAVEEAPNRKEPEVKTPAATAASPDVSAGREREQRQSGGRCTLSVSEGSLSLRAGGSDTITVSAPGAAGRARVTASTNHWRDIAVFPESRGGEAGRVKYSVISVSKRAGTFAVNFKSPCGVKTVPVTVRQR